MYKSANPRLNYMGGQNSQYATLHGSGNTNAQNLNSQVPRTEGISTLGLISIITMIIVFGFIAYWGIICYPLFFDRQRDYDMMHSSSSHTTTPTISGEFEKSGNYSSRSTTPSHCNE